jgi:hypothetical protein
MGFEIRYLVFYTGWWECSLILLEREGCLFGKRWYRSATKLFDLIEGSVLTPAGECVLIEFVEYP